MFTQREAVELLAAKRVGADRAAKLQQMKALRIESATLGRQIEMNKVVEQVVLPEHVFEAPRPHSFIPPPLYDTLTHYLYLFFSLPFCALERIIIAQRPRGACKH